MGKHEAPSGTNIPDARWINRNIDILEIAALLDIRRSCCGRFHCWEPDNHRNGDRNPSVAHWKAGNRLKCFVCNFPPPGPISLVMRILDLDFVQAVEWISACFRCVPTIPARKPTDKTRARNLDSVLDPVSYLVRTHIYAALRLPTRCVATALVALIDRGNLSQSPRIGKVSYAALQRYSGIKSSASIRLAIDELTNIGWMNYNTKMATQVTKCVNEYVLTPFSEEVRQLGEAIARDEQAEIQYERECAKSRKAEREKAFAERKLKIIALPREA